MSPPPPRLSVSHLFVSLSLSFSLTHTHTPRVQLPILRNTEVRGPQGDKLTKTQGQTLGQGTPALQLAQMSRGKDLELKIT